MPYSGEMEPEETTSSRQTLSRVEGWGHPPIFKNFNLELFLSKGRTGTKTGAETEERATQEQASLDPSHQQTSKTYSIVDDKMCLYKGAWCGCPLRGSNST